MKAWSLSFPTTALFVAPKSPLFPSVPATSPKRRRRPSLSVLSSSEDGSSHGVVSKDYDLLSTTEHSDGSFVFRFGDASELVNSNDAVSTSEEGIKPQTVKEDEAGVLDVKSSENYGVETDSVEMINYKVLTPVAVTELDNAVEQKETSTCNVEQVVEQKGEEENSISDNGSVLEQDEVANDFINDVACSPDIDSQVSTSDSHQEDKETSVSSSPEMEATDGLSTEDSNSNESEGVDDLLNSAVVENHNVLTEDGDVVDDVGENSVTRVIPEFSAVNTELRVDKEASTDNVEIPVSIEEMENQKVADGNLSSPKFEEAIDEGGTQNGDAGTSSLHAIEPETLGEEIDMLEELFLSSGATFLANPSKALTGREDAYFLYENWLGIADGVRHWSFEGTNDESYALELIENCRKIVTDNESSLIAEPVEVLSKAAEETQSKGSSTALIAYFDGQALSVANIGDSGFIIIRNGSIFKRSSPMMHEFNFPMHIERGDDPSKVVQVYKTDLEEGDIIITASDGLFDNVYDQEIVSVASKSLQSGSEPQEISELLARRALEVGQTASARSPFGDEAKAAGYAGYSGGKLDDVTVIVSLVNTRSSTSSSQ